MTRNWLPKKYKMGPDFPFDDSRATRTYARESRRACKRIGLALARILNEVNLLQNIYSNSSPEWEWVCKATPELDLYVNTSSLVVSSEVPNELAIAHQKQVKEAVSSLIKLPMLVLALPCWTNQIQKIAA